jgi:hypothetical protein
VLFGVGLSGERDARLLYGTMGALARAHAASRATRSQSKPFAIFIVIHTYTTHSLSLGWLPNDAMVRMFRWTGGRNLLSSLMITGMMCYLEEAVINL